MGKRHYSTVRTRKNLSWLCFHQILHENAFRLEQRFPAHRMASAAFVERLGDLPGATAEAVLRNYQGRLELHEWLWHGALKSLGVPEGVLVTPSGRQLLDHIARNSLLAEAHKPTNKPAGAFDPQNPSFLFDKDITHRAFAGVYLTHGAGNTKATAKFLNQGLASGDLALEAYHVERQLDGLIQSLPKSRPQPDGHWPMFDEWDVGLRWLCEFETSDTDILWNNFGGAGAETGKQAHKDLMAAIHNGDIHDAYRDAAEQAVREVPRRNVERTILLLKHYQRMRELAERKEQADAAKLTNSPQKDPRGNVTASVPR